MEVTQAPKAASRKRLIILNLGSLLIGVPMFLFEGIAVAFGSDSASTWNNLNMIIYSIIGYSVLAVPFMTILCIVMSQIKKSEK